MHMYIYCNKKMKRAVSAIAELHEYGVEMAIFVEFDRHGFGEAIISGEKECGDNVEKILTGSEATKMKDKAMSEAWDLLYEQYFPDVDREAEDDNDPMPPDEQQIKWGTNMFYRKAAKHIGEKIMMAYKKKGIEPPVENYVHINGPGGTFAVIAVNGDIEKERGEPVYIEIK